MGKKGGGSGGGGGKKGGGGDDKLKTCNFVKARHILCEKQGKIQEAWREISEGYLDDGNKIPGPKFGEVGLNLSVCVCLFLSTFFPSFDRLRWAEEFSSLVSVRLTFSHLDLDWDRLCGGGG